jgi:hypothetical protein
MLPSFMSSGAVLGRRKMAVRICSSPKRDITKAENDSEAKGDQKLSEGKVAIPHPNPQNQRGKKRKYDEFFQVEIFIFEMNCIQHSCSLILIPSYYTYLNHLSTLVMLVVPWHWVFLRVADVTQLQKKFPAVMETDSSGPLCPMGKNSQYLLDGRLLVPLSARNQTSTVQPICLSYITRIETWQKCYQTESFLSSDEHFKSLPSAHY